MRRDGFTLIEMLVALAITLVMMGTVVTLFGVITESVANSRSALEMSDRLRAARSVLQDDLDGATATLRPPLRPESDQGYFECMEGQAFDGASGLLDIFGDVDDVLMLTVRRSPPFIGKLNGATIESPLAEVVYFAVQDGPLIDATQSPPVRLFTLYRRVLLVAPGVAATISNPPEEYYDGNDISVRYEQPAPSLTPTFIPNTLGDLTKRENRFAHTGNASFPYGDFPFPVLIDGLRPSGWPNGRPKENAFLLPYDGPRVGDDVLLGNVLAFDVQVYDPGAPVFVESSVAVEPRDRGYAALFGMNAPVAFGAYADLGYATGYVPAVGDPVAIFNGAPKAESALVARPFIYDTWSLHYEANGLDEDSANGPDAATNGLDDDGNGLVDDALELDTLPPYSAPLRGIRITIRVYEPSSQQIREAIVVKSFVGD